MRNIPTLDIVLSLLAVLIALLAWWLLPRLERHLQDEQRQRAQHLLAALDKLFPPKGGDRG